jgi:hypothetical protein
LSCSKTLPFGATQVKMAMSSDFEVFGFKAISPLKQADAVWGYTFEQLSFCQKQEYCINHNVNVIL